MTHVAGGLSPFHFHLSAHDIRAPGTRRSPDFITPQEACFAVDYDREGQARVTSYCVAP